MSVGTRVAVGVEVGDGVQVGTRVLVGVGTWVAVGGTTGCGVGGICHVIPRTVSDSITDGLSMDEDARAMLRLRLIAIAKATVQVLTVASPNANSMSCCRRVIFPSHDLLFSLCLFYHKFAIFQVGIKYSFPYVPARSAKGNRMEFYLEIPMSLCYDRVKVRTICYPATHGLSKTERRCIS